MINKRIKKGKALFITLLHLSLLKAQLPLSFNSKEATLNNSFLLYNDNLKKVCNLLIEKELLKSSEMQKLPVSLEFISLMATNTPKNIEENSLETFFVKNPLEVQNSSIFIRIGDHYFFRQNFEKAFIWYDKVAIEKIKKSNKDVLRFRTGYSALNIDNKDEAKKQFKKLIKSSHYSEYAHYFLGYLAYVERNYNKAVKYFSKLRNGKNKLLKVSIPYFEMLIAFNNENFEKTIGKGLELLKNPKVKNVSSISKIIGESYFFLKHYEEALVHLKNFKGPFTNDDYYRLGYCYFKQKDYVTAINYFNKILLESSHTSQNAYYHLASSYLKMGRKIEALNTFKKCKEMDFDKTIKKEAWLNYIRLSYEIGNAYESLSEIVFSYMNSFPNTDHSEPTKLLANSYLTSKDYFGALKVLNKSRSATNAKIYQTVSFYYAIEFIKNHNYEEAEKYLELSLSKPFNEKIKSQCLFWKAEVSYHQGLYAASLSFFLKFKNSPGAKLTEEYKDVGYHLGHLYFKNKSYNEALNSFKEYIFQSPSGQNSYKLLINSYLEMGHCYYSLKKYKKALIYYDKAFNDSNQKEIITIQKSICQKLSGKMDEGIKTLKNFIATKTDNLLLDKLYYTLANIYTINSQPYEALQIYQHIESKFPHSIYHPKAILNQANIYFETKRSDLALDKLTTLVKTHRNTPESIQAIKIAKMIYADMKQFNEYKKWLKKMELVSTAEAEAEKISYNNAKSHFLKSQYNNALFSLKKYVKDYPNGTYIPQVNYYIGSCLVKRDRIKEAVGYFNKVIRHGNNIFTTAALTSIVKVYLSKKDWRKIIETLNISEDKTFSERDLKFFLISLMKSYYELGDIANTAIHAQKVSNLPNVSKKEKNESLLILANAYFKSQRFGSAKKTYLQILKNDFSSSSAKAEALYYKAFFEYKEGLYNISNNTIQEFSRKYPSEKRYAGESLLLMSKNFHALNDNHQASNILESVINNFSQFRDLTKKAEILLSKILDDASQKNKSPKTKHL